MVSEGVKFICERNAGKKIPAVLQEALGADVTMVPLPDPGDDSIVDSANEDDRIIITRDNGFPSRQICTINNGVIYIPQTMEQRTLILDTVLEPLRRLALSGKLLDLGHAVCTLTPVGVTIKNSNEEISIPIDEL